MTATFSPTSESQCHSLEETVWADARPFREHARQILCDTGASWRYLAALAGIAPRAMRKLLHGRTDGAPVRSIHVSTARALAAVSDESVLRAEADTVDVRPVRALLSALEELGWAGEDVRRWIPEQDWNNVSSGWVFCSAATAARVQICYDILTSPETRSPAIPPRRSIRHHA